MAKKVTGKAAKPADEGRAVPLLWVGLDDLPARTATNVVIQYHEDLFIMAWGFTNPPILLGTKAEKQKQIDEIVAVTVTPFAKVTLTEAQLEKTIKALQTGLKNAKAQKARDTK